MIEYEQQQDGVYRYVTELAGEFKGKSIEITFNENEEEFPFGGELVMKLKDTETGKNIADIKMRMKEVGMPERGVTRVTLGVVDHNIEQEGDMGMLLVLGAFFVTELGVDEVRMVDGIKLTADSEFLDMIESWLGESKMEQFLTDGYAQLQGGLAFQVVLDHALDEGNEGRIMASIVSADGREGYLDGKLTIDDDHNELVVYELSRDADSRWGDAIRDYRQEDEKHITNVVNEAVSRDITAGEEEWVMDDLTTNLLYLVGRYLKHELFYDVSIYIYPAGGGDPRQTKLDEKIMYGKMSEWLGF